MTTRADAHRPDFHREDSWKQPVRCATTGNITIATALNNGDTIDGITLATGDRVLVKDQSTGAENGIYDVGITPVRSYDMDTGLEAWGCIVKIQVGTANGGTVWTNTNATLPTIDTTALTFANITGGGSGAPTTADYLVGTANGSLSAEIVVGTTPGGELGGTWGSPTVDSTHSGSAHTDFIAKAIVDAKGDIIAATAADTVARLAVGADGTFLSADSSQSTGLAWAAASGSGTVTTIKDEGTNLSTAVTSIDFVGAGVTATGTTAVTVTIPGGGGSSALVLLEQHTASSSSTLDFTSTISSTYDDYLFELVGVKNATNTVSLLMRVSTDGGSSYDSGSNYVWSHMFLYPGASGNESGNPDTSIGLGGSVDNSHQGVSGTVKFYDPGSSVYKTLILDTVRWVASGISVPVHDVGAGQYSSNTAVNAVRFLFSSGNISSGTIRAYGIVK